MDCACDVCVTGQSGGYTLDDSVTDSLCNIYVALVIVCYIYVTMLNAKECLDNEWLSV